jgi:hypothetical protein
MQRNAERNTEFLIKAELSEAEEVLSNVFCEITPYELLAPIIERASSVSTSGLVKSRTKKIGVVRTHSIMHSRKLCTEAFNVVLDIRLQRLEVNTVCV